MKVFHTSFECYPIAKVGGLGDVVGALPKYQNVLGSDANVILPFYDNAFTKKQKFKTVYTSDIELGDASYRFSVLQLKSFDLGFNLYTIHIDNLLDREDVYGFTDETERYLGFQFAVLDWLNSIDDKPDVVHCHDHHTSLIPFLMKYGYSYSTLSDIPTVVTIHNAQYQGQMSYDKFHYLPNFNQDYAGVLDWYGRINPMATGVKSSWKVTTVSPSYMEELKDQANGLEGLLRTEDHKCVGILNGIDTDLWNPETDQFLVKNYKVTSVISGKKENKKALCKRFNLNPDLPLFGFIGRLVGEKSADLLPEVVKEVLDTMAVNLLILGSGHKDVEEELSMLKEDYKGRYNVYIGYDEALSHLIYAGSDFLLMPSRVEPCGLNQMYSLRYGTIPIVRRTGGLKDTVIDIGDENGFGICHDRALTWDICYSVKRAVELFNDTKTFRKKQKQIMKIDNSWHRSAKAYIELYESLN